VLVTDHVLGHPFAATRQVAEESLAPFKLESIPFQGSSALNTLDFNRSSLPVGCVLSNHKSGSSLPGTGGAACFLVRTGCVFKRLATLLTNSDTQSGILGRVFAFPILSPPLSNAGTITEVEFLDPGWTNSERLTTLSTFDSRLLFSFPSEIALPVAERLIGSGGINFEYTPTEFARLFNSLHFRASHAATPWHYLTMNIFYHKLQKTQIGWWANA
jgi:hypothetical protein